MKVNSNIFKEYDIRGKYPEEINKKTAFVLGVALVNYLKIKNPKIAVSRDLRPSSPSLAENFIKGAMSAGANITDIGQAMTPTLYLSAFLLKQDAGVMITSSHNKLDFNGFKIINKAGSPLNMEDFKKNPKIKIGAGKKGFYRKIDFSPRYLEEMTKDLKPLKKTKISIEARRLAKKIAPQFIKKLGIKSGKKAGISASFDYDADRLLISGKNSKRVRGDIIGAIVGDAITQKKDKIVCDLRCSRAVFEHFRNKGVRVILSKVGHYNIKKKMRETGAVFGMEISGHYYFKKFNYHEAPFYALGKLLEQIQENPGLKISEPFYPFEKFFHSGEINIPGLGGKNFGKAVEELKSYYRTGARNELDGLTAEFSNWWFNIRISKTEPLARLVIEANSPKLLEQKKEELIKKLETLSKASFS